MQFRHVVRSTLLVLVAAAPAADALATGVPIDGFLPQVGIGLSREFVDDIDFFPYPSTSLPGTALGSSGPFYDVALLDTGAAVSLLNTPSQEAFGVTQPYSGAGGADGFNGTNTIDIGGATGFVQGKILDPLGLYAGGLQTRTSSGSSLTMNNAALTGQTNTSLVVVPPESDLPNVLGFSFIGQYSTRIRSDQPQVFQVDGKTVRTPSVEFLPRGGGGLGISRKAPLQINGQSPLMPQYVLDFFNLDIDQPWENPFGPTFISGGLFLNIDAEDDVQGDGGSLENFEFFFDTGASVTVVSELNALRLGFDVILDEPEFTLAVVGSAGTKLDVPGFFVDEFTIEAIGGNVVAQNVPVIVLDITDPADPNNVIDGFVGSNLLSGRNLVIDPNPSSSGGPSAGLYISDPVTTQRNWTPSAASAPWSGSSWSAPVANEMLAISNVRHVAGGNQKAVVTGAVEAWEVNVSGAAANQRMTLELTSGSKLTTFSGVNVEAFGAIEMKDATLDAQYVQVLDGGKLSGAGLIQTGSGPIAGQLENVSGVVAPGDDGSGVLELQGRFSNAKSATLAFTLGGITPGVDFGQLVVDGDAAFAGTLAVELKDGYKPTAGDSFLLAEYNQASGQFSTLDLPLGVLWQVNYGAGELRLIAQTVSLPGDFDFNMTVEAADLADWQSGYGTSLQYSGAGFMAWQRNLGMTAGGGLAAVSEPAGAGLILAALAIAGVLGRRSARRPA